ncbi:stage V sporulation protein AA [Calditerricola satsumensis]|uniref:Stage V sporulation protein AA n=1 Tax=Calditerricola satsumensis TaxID=373054 RepID=A0A8J3B7P6_9BACI|nr:stage V sporulation protein AA [Calditerricola satsumensis]GGK00358.1 stage V sporulation protein AA [Calditerricola satsumensis]
MASANTTLYMSMKERIYVRPQTVVKVGDVATFVGDPAVIQMLRPLPLYPIQMSDGQLVVIDVMHVIDAIHRRLPHVDVVPVGPTETIIEVLYDRRRPHLLFVALTWILLFVGSGLALMNFHGDVSMEEVHRRLYFLITGEFNAEPLVLQIPYSLGIGVGMVLFFNHLFRKKLNEEPSPLEVEMFLYQQNLDQYVIANERAKREKDGP